MRVTITKDSQARRGFADSERFDLHDDPRSIGRIEAARQHPSLRGLLLNLNEDESPWSEKPIPESLRFLEQVKF